MERIRERICRLTKESSQRGDQVGLCMLRLVETAIKDRDAIARMSGRRERVSDEAIHEIIDRMILQRKASSVSYDEQGQLDLAENERAELVVLEAILPTKLTSNEVDKAVRKAIRDTHATSIRHRGRVLGALKKNYPGQVDFLKAGEQVDLQLSQSSA